MSRATGEAEPARTGEPQAEEEHSVPQLPDPPARYEQDTRPVDGETVRECPEGAELVQHRRIQG